MYMQVYNNIILNSGLASIANIDIVTCPNWGAWLNAPQLRACNHFVATYMYDPLSLSMHPMIIHT